MPPSNVLPLGTMFPSVYSDYLTKNAPGGDTSKLTRQGAANLLRQKLPGYSTDALMKWHLQGFPQEIAPESQGQNLPPLPPPVGAPSPPPPPPQSPPPQSPPPPPSQQNQVHPPRGQLLGYGSSGQNFNPTRYDPNQTAVYNPIFSSSALIPNQGSFSFGGQTYLNQTLLDTRFSANRGNTPEGQQYGRNMASMGGFSPETIFFQDPSGRNMKNPYANYVNAVANRGNFYRFSNPQSFDNVSMGRGGSFGSYYTPQGGQDLRIPQPIPNWYTGQ